MKKAFLVGLMAIMIAIPCLAEIEPDEQFSINGTLWRGPSLRFSSLPLPPSVEITDQSMFAWGFHQGKVYRCICEQNYCFSSYPFTKSFYFDSSMGSFAFALELGCGMHTYIAFIQPGGPGILTVHRVSLGLGYICTPFASFFIEGLYQIDDYWKPGDFDAINPNVGEQGTTITGFQIRGLDTTFQDDPPVEISFDPPEGLTVSNINVVSNTVIECDLAITTDAPIGYRTVIVTYDNGKQSIYSLGHEFQVLEKTN